MFSTLVAVISVLVLVLPGFVITDLQRRQRASSAASSDWDLILRALSYSLILHLAVSPWTRDLVVKVEGGNWEDHLGALLLYGAVVLALAPVLLGLLLNALLLRAERSGGQLKWWHYALGGRDARHSWDFIFQRITEGRWIVVQLKSGKTVAGQLGKGSWVSQSPAPGGHDLWLQEIWTVNDFGVPAVRVEPRQGMWMAREDVETLFVLEPPEG